MSWTTFFKIEVNEPMEIIEISSADLNLPEDSFHYSFISKFYNKTQDGFSWFCGDNINEIKIKSMCKIIVKGILDSWELNSEIHQIEVEKYKKIFRK